MNLLWIAFTAVGVLLGVILSARAVDPAMMLHGMIFSLASILCAFALIARHYRNAEAPSLQDANGGVNYNTEIVKAGVIVSTFWGVVGFAVGVVIALQLAFPVLNFDLPWTNFGRLRPLHTSAVIFAFGGNVLIATSFHVVQRTCRARLAGDIAPWFVFWGYQLFIVWALPSPRNMPNLNGMRTCG